MTEENGTGRLDRIERALELIIADHEQFRHDLKQLLTAQVLLVDQLDKLSGIVQKNSQQIQEHSKQLEIHHQNDRELDERVDKLVSAIGEFVRTRDNPSPLA